MRKLEDICEGSEEAIAIVGHLSAQGRAKLLTINRPDPIQGVKVCLAPGAVSTASSVDYNVLHLIWTTEKLEQQLRLIDQRYQKSRDSALGCLKDGNKRVALRYAAEMKMASQSRERCTALLDRVENVLQVITDAESSKKVSDAIQSSTHALKENQISVEEVEACLQEVAENIDSLKQLDKALQSTTAYAEIQDDDVEDEFNKLRLDITSEEEGQVATKTADALSNALSNLHLQSEAEKEECSISMSKDRILEAA
ncbi:charged multivesicular body protein 7, partial [Phtheirospermum japonicum]